MGSKVKSGKATKVYKTSEIAKLFGVTVSTVDRWIRQGNILASKTLGNHYRIEESEVSRITRGQRTTPWGA